MTEHEYTEMLEYAFKDEGEGIEFYNNFLNALPLERRFNKIRSKVLSIMEDEERHLAILAQLIDDLR